MYQNDQTLAACPKHTIGSIMVTFVIVVNKGAPLEDTCPGRKVDLN